MISICLISDIETITLWLLFLVFTLSATIFFLLLVYLDLVSNNKNSRELALCCGAFGWVLSLPVNLLTDNQSPSANHSSWWCFRVSLLTALRIWVSLPDELGGDPQGGLGGRPLISPCNCTNTRQASSHNNLHQVNDAPSYINTVHLTILGLGDGGDCWELSLTTWSPWESAESDTKHVPTFLQWLPYSVSIIRREISATSYLTFRTSGWPYHLLC